MIAAFMSLYTRYFKGVVETNTAERVCFFLLQGRVVENISKRCGGFLRKLSLRGCLGVGDSALR